MDKQMMPKLTMMLQGLQTRLSEDFDFVERIQGRFVSGVRETTFSFIPEGQGYRMSMGAASGQLDATAWVEVLLEEAGRQEALRLEVLLRGETLLLDAAEGKVNYRAIPRGSPAESLSEMPGAGKGAGMASHHHAGGLLTGREYLVKPGQADRLLREIGIMAENGKIRNDRIRKYNQIDHFVELLQPILDRADHAAKEMFIVDAACGKSYLSFVLNWYLGENLRRRSRFLGVDISEQVVSSSRETATRLNYRNMTFSTGDLRTLSVNKNGPVPRNPDLVISLHACDVATDYALAFGIRNRANAIVAVPCCQHELLNQMKVDGALADLARFGPLKARLADTVTDGLRCMMLEAAGYEVSCVEWVSPLETPKNLMIRAERNGEPDPVKYGKYRTLADKFHATPSLEVELLDFCQEAFWSSGTTWTHETES